ncbi:lipoprotein insertase outer membrane protein LolB [Pseudoalteromonas sp. T1lg76]|uniref:lipoprotein insertase outer membrane protein LolB n=1 Tax=Pseudoalteromonas sp. T1lg76 TaxID=2077103 RepID=UPI000CF70FF1|nr:lipoprotein insertase outer membrane protein LolB [Pseudoalteromonas sp. T1lg76]
MINFRLILLVFFLFITGCAQQIPKSTTPDDNWRQQLATISHFSAEGKMAFISPQKRQSANFVWQQQNKDYELDLNTFIGTNVLRLQKQGEQVHLEVDDEHYQDQNAQQLVYRLSGWLLPLAEPQSWLLGQLESDAELDELERVRSAHWLSPDQRRWQIRYEEYEAINGVWLPTRITLVHESLRVKLLINQWQVQ